MTRVYKTARGQALDMDKLKLSNEDTISVGNMRVNARGDVVGLGNQVAMGRNRVMDQIYAIDDGYSPNDPATYQAQQAAIQAISAKELNDLANNLVVPANSTVTKPAARGSLADSVAKNTTVVQQPIPDPRNPKSNGPTRI
jgi:hypothetical protein